MFLRDVNLTLKGTENMNGDLQRSDEVLRLLSDSLRLRQQVGITYWMSIWWKWDRHDLRLC